MSERRDDDDDAALFRAAIGAVRKLPEQPAPPAAPRPKPRARMAELDEANARDEFRQALDASLIEADDTLGYRDPRLPMDVYRRLRHGEIAAEDELDLHGADARSAETLLRAFLGEAVRHGVGCVRIIHGKGRRGATDIAQGGAPVLKNLVDRMLRQRANVLAFHSTPPAQGGTGAVLVLLATRRR